MKPETLAVHAGRSIDPTTGAVTTPIHLSTTFERDADGTLPRGYEYTRGSNPNRDTLEEALAALEGGVVALSFPSGMAAITALFQGLGPGDHVIVPDNVYYGVRVMLTELLAPWGLQSSFVDMTSLDAVRAAILPNTRLIFIETPSNPQIRLTDIAAVASLAHEAGLLLACDNSIPSPILQQPLALGADLVVHATTKFIAGHSDVLGGAIIAASDSDYLERIRLFRKFGGAVPSPFDCWLTLRGIKSLPYRMQAHSQNAQRIAEFLAQHPAIHQVLYPGLPSHPGHDIAVRQMRGGFGGLLSIRVRGGAAAAIQVAAQVGLFTRATSFGGAQSLIEHRATVEGPTSNTPDDLLRLSIGLEHADDLIEDLAQALA